MPEIFNSVNEAEKREIQFTEEAIDSLNKSNEELMVKMFNISLEDQRMLDGGARAGYTMAYFSTLLIKIARQAEESTKKIARLTWALLVLTVALLVVAIVQIVIFKQDTAQKPHNHQATENSKQIQTDTKSMPKVGPLPPARNEVHK